MAIRGLVTDRLGSQLPCYFFLVLHSTYTHSVIGPDETCRVLIHCPLKAST